MSDSAFTYYSEGSTHIKVGKPFSREVDTNNETIDREMLIIELTKARKNLSKLTEHIEKSL